MRHRVIMGAVLLIAVGVLLVPAVGQAANPNVQWTQGGTSIIRYDYGVESKTVDFALGNFGASASTKMTVTLEGDAQFTLSDDTCTGIKLRPGESCTVKVTYTSNGQSAQARLLAGGKSPRTGDGSRLILSGQ